MDKIHCAIHTMEQYSSIKKNEVLIDATRWIYLENTLSERNQTQKVTCCMLPLM